MEEEEKPCISDTVEDNKEIVRQFIDKEGIVWDRENFLDDSACHLKKAGINQELLEDVKTEVPNYSEELKDEPENEDECDERSNQLENEPCGSNMSDLNQEMEGEETHQEETNYHCCFCEYSSLEEKHLKFHVLTQHSYEGIEKRINCAHCSYTAVFPFEIKVHLRKIHWKGGKCECEFCKSSLKGVQLQYFSLKSKEKGMIECDLCEFTTSRKCNLLKHIKMTHMKLKTTNFKCQFCDFSANNRLRLKLHIQVRHNTSEEVAPFSCAYCDFKTLYTKRITNHMRMHYSSQRK